jgi:orotate phosphoribosyltransferase
MMNLFRAGRFVLHSGAVTNFLIDCNALTDEDLAALAAHVVARIPPFYAVEGVATGGLRFADALRPYVQAGGGLLIVDDVLTTGASMEEQRHGRDALGVVMFARGPCPPWVWPLFQFQPPSQEA